MGQCRFCLEEEEDGSLVSPCMCRGSLRFCHEKCLFAWQGEMPRQFCELCRTEWKVRAELWFAGVNAFRTMYVFQLEEGAQSMTGEKSSFVDYVPEEAISSSSPEGYVKVREEVPLFFDIRVKADCPLFPHAGDASSTFFGATGRSIKESVQSLFARG